MSEPEKNAAHETESGNRPVETKGDSVVGPGGVVLNQYFLLGQLSTSRTGLIFKAQHRLMGRVVAIKFLVAEAADAALLTARSHRTIQILARLEHRNLVKLYEAAQQDTTHYLVMEYVDGQDLRSILKAGGPLGVEDAVQYISQAAAGLAYIHQQGVCHRNIKPGNLLVDRDGAVKIVGFTLAHVEAGGATSEAGVEDNLTRQGQVMGTYDFMSPEQAMDSRSVDRRADIYSLGCTLHMLLTGRPPYVGKAPMQQVIAHRTQPIPSLRQTRPEIPEALDRVFQKMIAKVPGDRYASMEDVMADLAACLTPPATSGETTADHLREVIGLTAVEQRTGSAEPAGIVAPPIATKAAGRLMKAASRKLRIVPIVVGGLLALAVVMLADHWISARKASEIAQAPAQKEKPKLTGKESPTRPSATTSLPGGTKSQGESVHDILPPKVEQRPVENPVATITPSVQKDVEKPAVEPKPSEKKEPDESPGKILPAPANDPGQQESPKSSEGGKPTEKPVSASIPIPDETARERAAKLLHDMYQEEMAKARTGAEKSALAEKFLRQANGMSDDPAGRYVMLQSSVSLAKEGVDAVTAVEALEAIARFHTVDVWSLKGNLLADLAKNAKTSVQHRTLAQQAAILSLKAIKAEQFEIAGNMSTLAVSEAAKVRDPQGMAQIRAAAKEAEKIVAMHGDYDQAKVKLNDDPKNAEANLVAGRFECLFAGKWKEGLPKLAAGSDETWRELAAKDLAEPKDPDQQVAIGDGWWELSKAETGVAQAGLHRRARQWYEKALPPATGLLKGYIEKRLETISSMEKPH